jgi:hypothetical protein
VIAAMIVFFLVCLTREVGEQFLSRGVQALRGF